MNRSRSNEKPSRTVIRSIALGLAMGTLALCVIEWLAIRPRVRENDTLRNQLEAVRDENDRTERTLADYEAFQRDAAETDRRFAAAIGAVPTEAELAGALKDVENVTAASGVSLVRFAPSVTPTAPRPQLQRTPGAPTPPAGLGARPISVVVRCGFDDYQSLLGRLATYPRLLTIEGFRMRSANRDGFTIEAQLTLNCYFKPASETVVAEASR